MMTDIRSMDGGKPSQKLARKVLPLLVRQAWAGQPLSYKDVADEIGTHHRPMRFALGIIGRCLEDLSEEWDEEIPPLQAIVVNRQLGVPGRGLEEFLDVEYEGVEQERKEEIARTVWSRVQRYGRWEDVLQHFGLPLPNERLPDLPSGRDLVRRQSSQDGGSAEGEDHRKLKLYIAGTPEAVGLDVEYGTGETEYYFRSGDAVDVLFKGERWVGVEVKGRQSDVYDVMRGMFQCVKYRALLDANVKVEGSTVETDVMLALETRLPTQLLWLRNLLGLEVVEEIKSG